MDEQQLHKDSSKGKAPRRDLKALIKTLWAVIDKMSDLEGALAAISDKLDEMLNRQ